MVKFEEKKNILRVTKIYRGKTTFWCAAIRHLTFKQQWPQKKKKHTVLPWISLVSGEFPAVFELLNKWCVRVLEHLLCVAEARL